MQFRTIYVSRLTVSALHHVYPSANDINKKKQTQYVALFLLIYYFCNQNIDISITNQSFILNSSTTMRKFFPRFLSAVLLMTGFMLSSCSDDDNASEIIQPPTVSVKVTSVQRSSVSFSIESADGTDYAYIITEKGADAPESAEAIFNEGTNGMLDKGTAKISTPEVEGGKEFVIYTAVRKINPYVYSEIVSTEVNTDIPYTDMVTLNKIGFTDFAYHVEMPEGATKVKHLVVRENDYEAVKAILSSIAEVTPELYLETFGLVITESADFAYDKFGKDANGIGEDVHIHTATTFLIMAAPLNDEGKVIADQFQCVKFDTRRAEESPYDLDVTVSTTSTTATINITPDPEITDYRVVVLIKSEWDYTALEGEQQTRFMIIGHWDDSTNAIKRAYSGSATIKNVGLIPNSQYVIGIVGFDAEGREKVKRIDFITGEPTGPAPTLTITETTPSVAAPWNTIAYNVKASNAVEVRYGFWTKDGVDRVLGNGNTMEDVILNNGVVCSAAQLDAILSTDGLTFETNDLEPETEYVFAIYARTDEYVATTDYRVFTTEAMPQTGGAVRRNMPGRYIASTTDESGATITFPVTITTGVNDATISEYSSKNRLVALGFGPESKFPYLSPSETTSANPFADYGPKWFIEFYVDENNQEKIKVPNAYDKSWNMGLVNNAAAYIKGAGFRETANGSVAMNFPSDDFDVIVSEDGNTVTVKGTFHDIGANGGTTYPTMYSPGSGWFSPDVVHFQAYSDIVLTRQADSKSTKNLRTIGKMPAVKVVKAINGNEFRQYRENFINKLK